ncbi:hypothetical protein ACS8E9_17660 [Pseudomonas neustonica]|uniref:hypothetical protein n=1 Tax=Pseudomonas neustonica TaxID=2487346 RepID=UPI003F457AB2
METYLFKLHWHRHLNKYSETKGVAVASFDKAKNRYGWKAISRSTTINVCNS